MVTAEQVLAAPTLDVSKMTKLQKLAALLVILGPESAARILQTLSPRDLETVSAEMAKMPMITAEVREAVLREMSQVALAAGTALWGGVQFAQTALEKAVGAYRASDIINKVSPNALSSSAVQRLQNMDVCQLFNLLKDEHIQTIALVVSYLQPEKASELLCMLRSELRAQVVERLASLEPTPIEVVEKVVEVMQRRLSGRTSRGLKQSGGIKSAADILNALNKAVSKTIITSLEEKNPELGQAIRQKMFTFEDLATLDDGSLQKVMREVDMRDLALALKKADDKVKGKLLGAISKRAAEAVNEEISMLGSVKLKEISAAQGRIVDVVRRLEEAGEIDLEAIREGAGA